MSLENLMRYESAAVAGMKAKENPMISLNAMEDFYKVTGLIEDPYIQKGLKKTQESLMSAVQQGRDMTLENTGLLEAISVYNFKYDKAFNKEKISGLVGYLEGSCSLSKQAKQGLLEYKDITYKELEEKFEVKDISDEDKEKIQSALILISKLKNLKLEKSYIEMRIKDVEATANQLYKKPEKKKEA